MDPKELSFRHLWSAPRKFYFNNCCSLYVSVLEVARLCRSVDTSENRGSERARAASPPDFLVQFPHLPRGKPTVSDKLFFLCVSSHSLAVLILSEIFYLTLWLWRIGSFLLSEKLQTCPVKYQFQKLSCFSTRLTHFTHFPGVLSPISLANMVFMRIFFVLCHWGLNPT